MSKLFVKKHIKLKNSSVFIDGKKEYSVDTQDFMPFAKSVYKQYNIKYGKFYKMDNLSKLGFLASEILLSNYEKNVLPEEIAIIFANTSSSLNTDIKYQKSVSDVPSPSVFVYTLANIVIGEICIRNNIKGETMFFVQDDFDTNFMCNYVNNIFENTNTKLCIFAWVELSENGDYHADMYLISKEKTNIEFNNTNINTSFKL